MIWIKYPHFFLSLLFLGIAAVLAIFIIGIETLRRRLRHRERYMEELIKDRLSRGRRKLPKLVSQGRKRGYGRLEKLAHSRPQPAVRGTYDWGSQIGRRQREVEHILSGRR